MRRIAVLVSFMLVALAAGRASAAVKYVTPTGNGDGSDWANAYSNIQDAVNACPSAGDVIYVRYGTYSITSTISISGHEGLTIVGGMEGSTPEPGNPTSDASIVSRASGSIRLFNVNASTVTLARLTVQNGNINDNGAGLRFTNGCSVIVSNCVIRNNAIPSDSGSGRYGAGVHVSGGSALFVDTRFQTNANAFASWNSYNYGGGVSGVGAALVLSGCTFAGNYVNGKHYNTFGGALYLSGGSAVVSNCTFIGNRASDTWSGSTAPYTDGGAIYVTGGTAPLLIDGCTFSGNYCGGTLATARRGGVLYLSGAGTEAVVRNCVLAGNGAAATTEDVWIDAVRTTMITNTVISGSAAGALYKQGTGTLNVAQSLVKLGTGHGVRSTAGIVSVLGSTVAANSGWGISNSAATLTVRDCIVWGNGAGITNGTVSYTCAQSTHAGAGNLSADPQFMFGYYLSVNGLPFQSVDSPCIDAGSASASDLGVGGLTTRTDGTGDSGTVDLGYHYAAGVAGISNYSLYVDVGAGDDANDGWTSGTAVRTITNALGRVLPGGTIYIAAGLYTNGVGCEALPLVVATPDITLLGAGPDATIIDGAGSFRLLQATSQGRLRLDGIQFRNGAVVNANGGALALVSCNATMTNCTVRNSTITSSSAYMYGGGVYVSGGSFAALNCGFYTNRLAYWNHVYRYGGGLAAINVATTFRGCVFEGNYATFQHYDIHGGALYLSGGSAQISDCLFRTNYVESTQHADYPYGGAIYASGLNPLTIRDSTFAGNYARGQHHLGGVVYLAGAGTAASMSRCALIANGAAGGTPDIYAAGGTLAMTNVLAARGKGGANSLSVYYGNGLTVAGAAVEVVNCTFADNAKWGIERQLGVVTARNCIAWGNVYGGLAACTDVSYCDAQETLSGTGNVVTDPLFADTNYYHLTSRAGEYGGGFFTGGTWAVGAADSPVIDAGAPATPWQAEPQPNGRRANLGAYGATEAASKTYLEAPGVFDSLTVHSYAPTNVTIAEAWLVGEVLHTGGAEAPQAYFCWGDDDAGTASTGLWDHVIDMGSRAQWELFTTSISGFSATTYVRCYVTNSAGEDWSAPAESFVTVSLPSVNNSDASLIRRTSARLNGAIAATGGQTPDVWFSYWPDGGSPTSVVAAGPQTASFSCDVSGLSPDSAYRYAIMASNSAGVAWSPESLFTTLSTAPIGRYVSVTGAGGQSGVDWANAYAGIGPALLDCTYPGDTVFMKAGVYSNSSQIAISNHPGLIVSGGYAGEGAPGPRTNDATVLRAAPPPLNYMRVFYLHGSTVTLDRVTVENGYLLNESAAGLKLVGGVTVITNCVIRNNEIYQNDTLLQSGAGLYAVGSVLELYDTTMVSNRLTWGGYTHDAEGGAICAYASTVRVARCVFDRNSVDVKHFIMRGGAIALLGGSAWISDSTFRTNYIIPGGYNTATYAYGGAIYAQDMVPLAVDGCTFVGNMDYYGDIGGCVYLTGAGQRAAFTRCIFTGNGGGGYYPGDIYVAGGSAAFTNVLVARATSDGLRVAAGATATVRNGTFANNRGWGVTNGGGTAVVLDSIAWANSNGGVANASATYTLSQEALAGAGNTNATPLFVDTVYYHLQSVGGQYAGGYFSDGSWGEGASNSPAIDAGDLSSPYDREPMPNGRRVNLGFYGNTETASKTQLFAGSVFFVR